MLLIGGPAPSPLSLCPGRRSLPLRTAMDAKSTRPGRGERDDDAEREREKGGAEGRPHSVRCVPPRLSQSLALSLSLRHTPQKSPTCLHTLATQPSSRLIRGGIGRAAVGGAEEEGAVALSAPVLLLQLFCASSNAGRRREREGGGLCALRGSAVLTLGCHD